MEQRAKDALRHSGALFTAKRAWDSLCQDIAEQCYPLRADFTQTLNLSDGFAGMILDSTPVMARETLGNAIDSMLRQGEWFTIGTGDEDRDQRPANARALDYATKAFRNIIRAPATGFAQATKEADHDWAAFGTNVMSWEVAPQMTHLVARVWHPRDCAWMIDEMGRPDHMYRRIKMSAREIKRRFQFKSWRGTLHSTISEAAEKEPYKEFDVLHCLLGAEEFYGGDREKLKQIKHQYLSMYIDVTNEVILNERGSRLFNYNVGRWRTLGTMPWGVSPAGINTLPDSRMLQDMARVILEQGEKAVDPPLVARSDLFAGGVNLYAGGHSAVDLGEGERLDDVLTTLDTSGHMQIGLELKQDVRELIGEGWLVNKLFLPSVREMRELEVAVRTEEFRRAALPFFVPIESQYHEPFLAIGFELAMLYGAIDPRVFTPDLQGQDVRFTFQSPLNEVEGRKQVEAFFAATQIAAAAAEVDNTVASIFDFRKMAEDAVRGAGAEPDWIRDEEERKAKDKEAENLQKLQQAAAVAQQGSAVVTDMANATMAAKQAQLAA